MTASAVAVTRTPCTLVPDPRRVLARPFLPGEEIVRTGSSRAAALVQRILGLAEPEVTSALSDVLERFAPRHRGFEQILERSFGNASRHIEPGTQLSRERSLLIGAYFTHEFSVEAAALFNPSMVLAPDQSGLPPGHCRFVMSLRAVGEGHTSSIEFRVGTIDSEGGVTFDPVGPMLVDGRHTAPASYDKQVFRSKLRELGAENDIASSVLSRLSDPFTPDELETRARVAGAGRRSPRHPIRDHQDHPCSRRVHVHHDLSRRLRSLRTGDLPGRAQRDPRDGGCSLRPLRR